MSTTATVTVSASQSSVDSGSTATMSASPSHGSGVFGSSSLLFGFVFMAILIIFMAFGFLWQRVVLGRHGVIMNMYEQMCEKEILQRKPSLTDAHVQRASGGGRWRGLKPLAVKLLPPPKQPFNASHTAGTNTTPTTLTQARPSVMKRFLDWLDPRPFHNPLLPSPPPGFRFPPQHQKSTKKSQEKGLKGKERDPTKRREGCRVEVSVIIAMPSRHNPLSTSSSTSTSILPLSSHFSVSEPEELYCEFGVTQVPVRFRSPSSYSVGDDDDFLDKLLDDMEDDDNANNNDAHVDSTVARLSR